MREHIKSLRSFFDRPTEVVVKEGAIHLIYATLILATGVLHGIEIAISLLHNYTDELTTKVDPAKRRQGKKIGSFLHKGSLSHPLLLGNMSFRGSGGPPPDEIVPSSVSAQPAAEVIVSTPLSMDETTATTTVTRDTISEAIRHTPWESSEELAEVVAEQLRDMHNQQAIATV